MTIEQIRKAPMDDEAILNAGKDIEMCNIITESRNYHKAQKREARAMYEYEHGFDDEDDDVDDDMIW